MAGCAGGRLIGDAMTEAMNRGEEAVLRDYLGHFRATFAAPVRGAGRRAARAAVGAAVDDVAARAAAPPRRGRVLLVAPGDGPRLDLPKMWGKDEDRDADFDGAVADDAVVAEAWEAWRGEVAYAEAVAGDPPDGPPRAARRRGRSRCARSSCT